MAVGRMAVAQQLLHMDRWRREVAGDDHTMRIVMRDISSMIMGNKTVNWLPNSSSHWQLETLTVACKRWPVIQAMLVQTTDVQEVVLPMVMAVEVQALDLLSTNSLCLQTVEHSNVATNVDDVSRGDTFTTNDCRNLILIEIFRQRFQRRTHHLALAF